MKLPKQAGPASRAVGVGHIKAAVFASNAECMTACLGLPEPARSICLAAC